MNGLGDQIFTGAALALHQDRSRLTGGDLAHEAEQLRHLLRDTYHVVVARATADLTAQRLDLGAQASGL